jgi:hypothetical protein
MSSPPSAFSALLYLKIVFFRTILLGHASVAFICAIWEICGSSPLPSEGELGWVTEGTEDQVEFTESDP